VRRPSNVCKRRTVPGQCHFTFNNPTNRRTGAEEFLVVPKLHQAPYDVYFLSQIAYVRKYSTKTHILLVSDNFDIYIIYLHMPDKWTVLQLSIMIIYNSLNPMD